MNLIRVFKTHKNLEPDDLRLCLKLDASKPVKVKKSEKVSKGLFGPNSSNSAHSLRLANQPGVTSCHTVQELSAEHAHELAVQAWLDGGSIGPRPQLSDFIANRRTLSQKAEALAAHLTRCIDNLFASGI